MFANKNIVLLQAAQSDAEAADLIMQINEKVNGDKLLSEQQKLVDEQTTQLERLEEKQSEELRRLNQEAEEERSKDGQEILHNNQLQKQMVSVRVTLDFTTL